MASGTTEFSDELKNVHEDIGQSIRRLRKLRGMTLENLSQKTSLSGPLLSQIENGHVNVNIANLWKISHALGEDIGAFFKPERLERELELILGKERKKVVPIHAKEGSTGYTWEHVASIRGVEIFLVEVDEMSPQEVPLNTHDGFELVLALEGSVEFISKDHDPIILDKWDSLKFPARYPHGYRGINKKAKLLGVLYPEEEIY